MSVSDFSLDSNRSLTAPALSFESQSTVAQVSSQSQSFSLNEGTSITSQTTLTPSVAPQSGLARRARLYIDTSRPDKHSLVTLIRNELPTNQIMCNEETAIKLQQQEKNIKQLQELLKTQDKESDRLARRLTDEEGMLVKLTHQYFDLQDQHDQLQSKLDDAHTQIARLVQQLIAYKETDTKHQQSTSTK